MKLGCENFRYILGVMFVLCTVGVFAANAETNTRRFFTGGFASSGPALRAPDGTVEWSVAEGREPSDGWVLSDESVSYSF